MSWRFFFLVGSMAHTMQCAEQLPSFTDGLCDPEDVDAMVERMVTFCCAGLRAPESALEHEEIR